MLLTAYLCLSAFAHETDQPDTHHCAYISIKDIPHAQGAALEMMISALLSSSSVAHDTVAHLDGLSTELLIKYFFPWTGELEPLLSNYHLAINHTEHVLNM